MNITFDAENHLYYNEKGFIVPSTTEVIGAVYGTGLENAPAFFVERAAEKGTKIHKEIESYIKGEPLPEELMPETNEFIDYVVAGKLNLKPFAKTETILWASTPFGEVCGTADLFCNGWLIDFKTSKTATREQKDKWQKQLSFYLYAMKKDGKSILGAKILHITANGVEEIPMEYLGDKFVEETMRLYSEGKKAEEPAKTTELQTITNKELMVFADILKRIKAYEEQIADTKEAIKAEMEKRNILALDLDGVSISYIAPSKRKSFDSVKFKAEHGDLFNAYQKESAVKSSIRISVK